MHKQGRSTRKKDYLFTFERVRERQTERPTKQKEVFFFTYIVHMIIYGFFVSTKWIIALALNRN